MRLVLLLPVMISVAAPAYAEGARESRYGPTTPRQSAAAAAPYTGPLLGWASKQASVTSQADTATQPAPIAPWARYQPASVAASSSRVAAPTPSASALPDSLYATPRAKPTAPSLAARAPTSPAPAPPTPPAAAPPRQQVAAMAGAPRTTGARFYSVSRESGLTPDPIPPAGPDTRVLITADAPAASAQDATPVHGSADWLAAGVNGDDDQDNDGDRRTKTRNQDQ
jgi:hypothetical protein